MNRPATVPIRQQRPPGGDRGKPRDSLLNIEEISRFDDLLIFARTIVEGYFAGRHKSPYFGSAAEFADYREYLPGDDPSKLDWRVYGRTRRLYVRQYEEETDMVVYLLVDTSGSMNYANPHAEAKLTHAGRIAAALAYLVINQGDKVSLTLFDDHVHDHLPPGSTRGHLFNLVRKLETVTPRAGTGVCQALQECAGIFRKRGQIVILSDFLTDPEPLFDAVSQFTHRRFDVLLMQLVDDDELHLPDVDNARFVDMETGEQIQVEPAEIRRAYTSRVGEFNEQLARQAHRRRLRHRLVETRYSYLQAIDAYLGFRHGGPRG